MIKVAIPHIAPVSFEQALTFCLQVQKERGIALFVPGDLHLWGVRGGNRSDLLSRLMEALTFDRLVLAGDMFDSERFEFETPDDRRVLEHIRELDGENRVHIVLGNHDRKILLRPKEVYECAKKRIKDSNVVDIPDLSWLVRPRIHQDVVYAVVDDEEYCGPAHVAGVADAHRWHLHTGVNDVLVVRVADKHIMFEHGDVYDAWARRARKSSILAYLGKSAFDLAVLIERHKSGFTDVSGTLKRKVSKWRGVCRDVAQGAYTRSLTLPTTVHANVCGHTHYPAHLSFGGVPHVNVGSFRGYRPSFALVTRDTGDVLPPIVVRYERE